MLTFESIANSPFANSHSPLANRQSPLANRHSTIDDHPCSGQVSSLSAEVEVKLLARGKSAGIRQGLVAELPGMDFYFADAESEFGVVDKSLCSGMVRARAKLTELVGGAVLGRVWRDRRRKIFIV